MVLFYCISCMALGHRACTSSNSCHWVIAYSDQLLFTAIVCLPRDPRHHSGDKGGILSMSVSLEAIYGLSMTGTEGWWEAGSLQPRSWVDHSVLGVSGIRLCSRSRFFQPRPVPLVAKDALARELERLEDEGVLTKVEFSHWVTMIVPVP